MRDRIFATYLELTGRPVEPDGADGRRWWSGPRRPFRSSSPTGRKRCRAIGETLRDGQTLMAGAVRVERSPAPAAAGATTTPLLTIDDRGEIVDAFDKVHLVPFGEYLPFHDVLQRVRPRPYRAGRRAFEAGSRRRPLDAGGVSALPFICYEIIFPGMAGAHAAASDMILNVTNDAWFGDTPGPHQHLRQAQYRAVEARLPLARAANNGISAVVDSYGRIVDALAIDAVGVLDVAVPRHHGDGARHPESPLLPRREFWHFSA